MSRTRLLVVALLLAATPGDALGHLAAPYLEGGCGFRLRAHPFEVALPAPGSGIAGPAGGAAAPTGPQS